MKFSATVFRWCFSTKIGYFGTCLSETRLMPKISTTICSAQYICKTQSDSNNFQSLFLSLSWHFLWCVCSWWISVTRQIFNRCIITFSISIYAAHMLWFLIKQSPKRLSASFSMNRFKKSYLQRKILSKLFVQQNYL